MQAYWRTSSRWTFYLLKYQYIYREMHALTIIMHAMKYTCCSMIMISSLHNIHNSPMWLFKIKVKQQPCPCVSVWVCAGEYNYFHISTEIFIFNVFINCYQVMCYKIPVYVLWNDYLNTFHKHTYTYIHTYIIHAQVHTYIRTHTHTYTHRCIQTYII